MNIRMPVFGAAIVFTILGMGAIGAFVLLPIAVIQWGWNSLMESSSLLPLINVWQAGLLYLALAVVVYASGLIRVEFETEHLE